jgi:aryl-alcohol dehydrogenase-like predicted oxidoreductase
MEYRALDGTDLKVSVIGFGASPLGNEFGAIDPDVRDRIDVDLRKTLGLTKSAEAEPAPVAVAAAAENGKPAGSRK